MRTPRSRDVANQSGTAPASPRVAASAAARAQSASHLEPGFSFVSYGVSVGVRVNDASLLARLPEHLPPGWRPASSRTLDEVFSITVGSANARDDGSRAFYRLCLGDKQVARSSDAGRILEHLESWVRLMVAVRARGRVFVHAGVVSWRGRALVVPGRSCSGKTTLVAALVRAGATYYSDEYAIVDRRGRVYPFPKPLSIRQGPGRLPLKCPAESLGGKAGKRPLRAGLVVLTHHRRGARWKPRVLSPAQGLIALLANTPSTLASSEDAVRTLKHLVAEAVTLKGARGEADEVAAWLLRYLDQTPAQRPALRRKKVKRANKTRLNAYCAPGLASV